MKRTLFAIAAACVALVACKKEAAPVQKTPGEKVQVTFNIASTATKADQQTSDESKLNTIDAFVFNADGTIDGYAHVTSTTTVTVTATTGTGKHFVVVANAVDADKMAEVDHINDLAATSRVFSLGNNTRTSFQMYGYNTQDLVSGTNNVNITVKRAVARVKVDKITRDFSIPSTQGQAMTIDNIYLSTVVGAVANVETPYTTYYGTYKTGAGDTWYNKYDPSTTKIALETENANVKSLTNVGLASPANLANENSWTTGCSLYTMPNNIKPGTLAEEQALQAPASWVPGLTKLVIETTLASKKYYYAIPIVTRDSYPEGTISEGIVANKTYNFSEIVLTRPGSENPDIPVSTASVTYNIEVEDWTVVAMETTSGKYEI